MVYVYQENQSTKLHYKLHTKINCLNSMVLNCAHEIRNKNVGVSKNEETSKHKQQNGQLQKVTTI